MQQKEDRYTISIQLIYTAEKAENPQKWAQKSGQMLMDLSEVENLTSLL